MSDKENLEKEVLISGYLDEQLTPRQLTELKRLLAHDPQLKQEIEAMQRQCQLLQSLPVETAPEGMAHEVQSVLERQFLLGGTHHRSVSLIGTWNLRFRKALAVAAMVLVPLLALGVVVYTILQPSGAAPGVPSEPTAVAVQPVSKEPVFSAVLQFQTGQPVAANEFIEKKIHTLGLMNFTATQRQSDRTSYKVVCPQHYIEGLVGELEGLWPQCQRASYAVLDTSANQPVRVDAIDPKQTLAMIRLADISAAAKLAQDFSSQNAQKSIANTNSTDSATAQLPEKAPKPILAWDEGKQQVAADEPNTICLVIEVLGQ